MSRAWPSDNQGRAGLLFSCFGCIRSFAPARSVARWDTVASALRHAYANVLQLKSMPGSLASARAPSSPPRDVHCGCGKALSSEKPQGCILDFGPIRKREWLPKEKRKPKHEIRNQGQGSRVEC